MTTAAEVAQLQAEVAAAQDRLQSLQGQHDGLHEDLSELRNRYEALVTPQVKQVELVKREIKRLEEALLHPPQMTPPPDSWTPPPDYVPVAEQYYQSWVTGEKKTVLKEDDSPAWIPPDDYIPVEEQYRRTWTPHQKPKATPEAAEFIPPPPPPPSTESDLKSLYRQLARRFHPDFGSNPADIARRTAIMAEINAAYEEENVEVLRAFWAAVEPDEAQRQQADRAGRELQAKQLRIVLNSLRRRIFALKQNIHDLEQSDLMRLKHEVHFYRLQGRDLLAEMADGFRAEYQDCLRKLYRLRQEANRA